MGVIRTSSAPQVEISPSPPFAIPWDDFGGEGLPLHFAHANGYPPLAYAPLLNQLREHFRVVAMRQRPLWPHANPQTLSDWRPLAEDLAAFLDQQGFQRVIGVGHSLGATTTLRLALQQPHRFLALVLIDPVIFPPWMVALWKGIYALGLGYSLHPLVKRTLRRRQTFESKEAMFANYRKKSVFRFLDDAALQAYVNALACPTNEGYVTLCYPKEWEARIYVTGVHGDDDIWQGLSQLKPAALFLRGAATDTFWQSTATLIKKRLPHSIVQTIPAASHLLPLERPREVFQVILEFLQRTLS